MEVGEEVATERLRSAITEQARLADAYNSAAGTPAEMSAYMRLQASNLQVALCDRMLNGIRRMHSRTATR
jgi:hypothetical protein